MTFRWLISFSLFAELFRHHLFHTFGLSPFLFFQVITLGQAFSHCRSKLVRVSDLHAASIC